MKCSICENDYPLVRPEKIEEPWICWSCNRGDWTRENLDMLKTLRKNGMPLSMIAKKLHKPWIAVQRKASYLGLTKQKRKTHATITCEICGQNFVFTKYYAKSIRNGFVCDICSNGSDSVGNERITKRGLVQVKLPKKEWQMKHIVLWLLHKGPIPSGYYINFKDDNERNITIENLELKPLSDK